MYILLRKADTLFSFSPLRTNVFLAKTPEKTSLAPVFYRKYPNFVRLLQNRAANYNRQMEDIQALEREGKIFVIRAKTPLEIGRICHDPEIILKAYRRGRADATKQLDAMRRWLETAAAEA